MASRLRHLRRLARLRLRHLGGLSLGLRLRRQGARVARRRRLGGGKASALGELQVVEEVLAVVLGAVEVALLQALGRVVAPGVVGDRDPCHLGIAERGLALPADPPQRRLELADAAGERGVEVGVAAREEVVGVGLEELQVELEDAEAVAELVGARRGAAIVRDVGRHVDQALARDLEHAIALRRLQQLGLVLREGAPPAAGRRRVDRVADAELEDARGRQSLAAQPRPDPAGLLARDRGDHVDAERRSGDGRLDLRLELALEPERVLGIGHVVLSLPISNRAR